MTRRSFILLPDDTTWRVAVVQDSAVTLRHLPVNAQADEAGQAMKELGHQGESILLAIPSPWCFAAKVETAGLSRRDAKALLYRLEESLPLAAEELTADFVTTGEGSQALGVAVRVSSVGPLVNALEAAGVSVQSIVPAAVLAAQFIAGESADLSALVAYHDSTLDLLDIASGELRSWIQSNAGEDDSRLAFDLMSIESNAPPRVIDLKRFADTQSAPVTDPTFGVIAACRCGADILQGRTRPWIELRSGPMAAADSFRQHRGPVHSLLVAVAVLFLVSGASLLFRAHRYNRAAEAATHDLADQFRDQFPDRPLPEHVSAILASERRKLESTAPGRRAAGIPASALRTLQAVISHLPDNGHFALDHMTFEGAAFELTGHIVSYEQVDSLVTASRAAGFNIAPPEAHRTGDGFWSFTLRGDSPRSVAQNVGGNP